MKKTKLLILSLLTLASSSAWGQNWEDITSTYLTNADFTADDAISVNLCGYSADASKEDNKYNGENALYWAQDVTGWTVPYTKADGNAGAIFAYGSDQQMRGNKMAAPATNPEGGNSGKALGIFAVWTGTVQYIQDITLQAGHYKFQYTYYNQSGTGTITNYCGFIPKSGTASYASNTTFSTGEWKTVEFEFTLSAETEGQISLGYKAPNSGSGACPMLFIDNVKLFFDNKVDKTNLKTLITEANTILYSADATGASEFNSAIVQASEINTKENATIAEVLKAENDLQDAIETYLAANNTNIVVNGTFDSNKDGWTSTTGASNQGITSNKTGDFTGSFWENWNASPKTGMMYQTNAIALPAGHYLLRIAAFGDQAPADEDSKLYVYANDQKKAVVSDAPTYYYVPFTLAEDAPKGTIEYGLTAEEGNKSGWLGIDNVSIYFLDEKSKFFATETEYTALAAAIESAETHTLGFEKDEYAPYNNVAGAKALATAKAINPEANNSKNVVVEATTALTSATWTPNTEEVNAVYDGTFANATQDGAPAGWTMSNNTLGGEKHSRTFVGDGRLSEFNETKSGFFMRFDGTNSDRGSMYYYGNTEGYTMPLKAETTYYVSVDAKNWGDKTNKPLKLNVTGPEGFTAKSQQLSMKSDADKNNDAPQNFFIVFTTTDAGNYVINFQCPGGGNEHNVMISNVELKKAASANMTITDAKWATFCAPFDVEIPEGVTAYTAAETDGNIEFTEVETIEAGTPVVVYSESDVDKTFYGATSSETTCDAGALIGTFVETTIDLTTGGKQNYVLQNHEGTVGFYKVAASSNNKIKANRCYMSTNVTPAADVKGFVLDDIVTGISQILSNSNKAAEGIYDLNGNRLAAPQKGINIINGVKVLVK